MLNEEKRFKCIDDCNKYVAKKQAELEGCSDGYKIKDAIFSTFNHLSVYFPDAYEHMLKVWEIENA